MAPPPPIHLVLGLTRVSIITFYHIRFWFINQFHTIKVLPITSTGWMMNDGLVTAIFSQLKYAIQNVRANGQTVFQKLNLLNFANVFVGLMSDVVANSYSEQSRNKIKSSKYQVERNWRV